MPKRNILGWQILLSYNALKSSQIIHICQIGFHNIMGQGIFYTCHFSYFWTEMLIAIVLCLCQYYILGVLGPHNLFLLFQGPQRENYLPHLVYLTVYFLRVSSAHESYFDDMILIFNYCDSGFRFGRILGKGECIWHEEEIWVFEFRA